VADDQAMVDESNGNNETEIQVSMKTTMTVKVLSPAKHQSQEAAEGVMSDDGENEQQPPDQHSEPDATESEEEEKDHSPP
jgi:hypothetical protein